MPVSGQIPCTFQRYTAKPSPGRGFLLMPAKYLDDPGPVTCWCRSGAMLMTVINLVCRKLVILVEICQGIHFFRCFDCRKQHLVDANRSLADANGFRSTAIFKQSIITRIFPLQACKVVLKSGFSGLIEMKRSRNQCNHVLT
jgi:hypothetical protein